MRLIHIIAGLMSLIAGALALYAAKGSPLHKRAGLAFVAAMLTMTTSAVIMAAFLRPNAVNVVAGTLAFYLVTTSLLVVRRTIAQARALTIGLMLMGLAASVFAFALGSDALHSAHGGADGIPAPPLFLFAAVGLLGVIGDLRVLMAGSIQGAQRIARHLWRMTFALWMATASFFLGQAKFFPAPLRKLPLLATPVLVVLVLLFYWLGKVLIKRRRGVGMAARIG